MLALNQEIVCGMGLAAPIVRNAPGRAAKSGAGRPTGGAAHRRVKTAFGYHFLDTSRNRRQISSSLAKHEDAVLSDRDREKLSENARDVDRNFAVAAWAIRRHLDFVSTWRFHCRAADRGLRRDVEAYIRDRERAANFDYTGRHPRRRFFRLLEARRVLDGDAFGVRLANGTVQGIEAEQIRNPSDPPAPWDSDDDWSSGVFSDAAGRPQAYAVHYQDGSSWQLDRAVPAAHCWHHAYWGGRLRQTRGISPMTAGLSTLVDTYEGIDLLTARLKVDQLFALALTRNADDAPAPITEILTGSDGEEDTDRPRYEVDFGRGPVMLDLDPGDDAKFLTSNSPAAEARAFIQDLIAISLSALDIPVTFWDSTKATFSGGRSAALLYVKACEEKREDVRDLHIDWTDWQLARAFANGDLLPPSGMDTIPYVWHSAGIPWWNPGVEVRASVEAIDNKLTSRQRVVEETLGVDFFDLLDELASEEEAIGERFPVVGAGAAPVTATEDQP
jgi:capsid protein